MTAFRIVRQFNGQTSQTEARAYRVETVELLTENEAFKLMAELRSPYVGRKYEETLRKETKEKS